MTNQSPEPLPDTRPASWVCAWNRLQDAQEFKQPPEGVRVAPEPLPDRYWAAVAEAAVYADLARADMPTGITAGALLAAIQTAVQNTVDTITSIFGIPPAADWPDNPDGSCPGCGVPVDGIHLDTCAVYLGRLRGGKR